MEKKRHNLCHYEKYLDAINILEDAFKILKVLSLHVHDMEHALITA